MISINIILTTIGRESLRRMLKSLVHQLYSCDYLTIISDGGRNDKYVREYLNEQEFVATVIHIHNYIALGYWGHASRNKYQNLLPGDVLLNADDDDRYTDGAFDKIRESVKEKKLYIFKHEDNGNFAWSIEGKVELGNIGTSCGVIPNTHDLPDWKLVYGGDAGFYVELSKRFSCEWVDHVIYKVKNTP